MAKTRALGKPRSGQGARNSFWFMAGDDLFYASLGAPAGLGFGQGGQSGEDFA
jgi:hypothetical protein